MTLDQFVATVRRRHNAVSDSNWSDDEIYELITHRCNEILSYIGLLQDISTSTSTLGTQTVSYPSSASSIKQVEYKNRRLKRLTFDQWNRFKTNNTTQPSGTPTMFAVWNRTIYLIPIPSASSDTITVYYYKEHPYIDGNTQTTIDIPSVLHAHLVHGVLADMFAKDLNVQFNQIYETKWEKSISIFQRYKADEEDAGQAQTVIDSDTDTTGGYY